MARSETAARRSATSRRARVAQIVATGPDGTSRASGYLVSRGRVLTSAHGLADATEVTVRFPAAPQDEREYEASVAFRHAGIDVAVLSSHPPPGGPPAGCAGGGERDVDIECHAVGFPLWKLRQAPDGTTFREAEDARGRCSTLSNWREGTLDLRLSDPPSEIRAPRGVDKRDGEYRPWEGMSGAAVFSEGRIVGVVVRHYLSDRGRLTACRADRWLSDGDDGRLSVVELHELERALGCEGPALGSLPDVPAAAAPLPRGVRTHDQETRLPSNRRKYLTGSDIPPFVSPGEGHEADPDVLLERLAELSAPGSEPGPLGVVLVGVAGSGKSRTCFEVAQRAHDQGWSVLHVAANASTPAEELAKAVAARQNAGDDVLLVFDYLDSYRQLDLRDFTDELGAAAEHTQEDHSPPARLACLASLRPGAVQRGRTNGYFDYFERRDLSQEENHQDAVTRSIVESVAPQAVSAYGADEVLAVCGRRPVLAMLIARAIESHAERGERNVLNRPGLLKDGGLSTWLRRRTDDDFAGRRTSLLASAVAAACCAQQEKAVRDAVGTFLELHDDREFTSGGIGVIQRLTELGWLLESEDKGLDVMHDFVADELLQQALLPDGQLQDVAAARMFTAFATTPRTLKLAAEHVRRWTAELDPAARRAMRRVCDDWLANRKHLGELLANEADLALSRDTLLALLSGSPWQSGAVQAWDELIEPWLQRARDEAPHLAQRLLTDAVRDSDKVPERLSKAALEWQQAPGRSRQEVRGVLEALLRATGACDADRRKAAALAVEWLSEHGTNWNTRPLNLAQALLVHSERRVDAQQSAVGACLAVIAAHMPVPTAATGFLLDRLLSLPTLEPDHRERAVRLAVRWLDRHRGSVAASFVLAALLQREDLTPGQEVQAAGAALAWLDRRSETWPQDRAAALAGGDGTPEDGEETPEDGDGTAEDREGGEGTPGESEERDEASEGEDGEDHDDADLPASFVLARLLGHSGLRGEVVDSAAEVALKWLRAYGDQHPATYVLGPLLDNTEAHQDCAADVVRHAYGWLARQRTSEDAYFVLRAVLENTRLPGARPDEAAGHAMVWLNTEDYGTREEARSVLGPLLKLRRPDPERERCAAGVRWLSVESNLASEEASFVFEPLLRRGELGSYACEAGRLALDWLSRHRDSANFSFVLEPLLSLRNLDEEHVAPTVDFALDAVQPGDGPPRATDRFILPALLREDRAGARAAPSALAWLQEFATVFEASHVLAPLLACPGLEEADTDEAVRHALDWLDVYHEQQNARWVRDALIGCPVPDPELRGRAVQQLFGCVAHGHVTLSKGGLQRLATLQRPLPTELADSLVQRILDAVGDEISNQDADSLAAALDRRDVSPRTTAGLLRVAMGWLRGDSGMRSTAGKLLRALLCRPDLEPGQSAEALSLSLKWLRFQGSSVQAAGVLGALLARGDVPARVPVGDQAPREGVPGGGMSSAGEAPCTDGETGEVDVVGTALTWLDEHPGHPRARHVLVPLLAREDLTGGQTATAVRLANDWLGAAEQYDDARVRELTDLVDRRRSTAETPPG